MSTARKQFHRLSDRIQRRFRSARPGSVLILVVALLVLMALIGTAWISSARIDRYASRQSSANTQIDLLVDGVVNMVKAAELGDLVGGGVARPAAGAYRHADNGQADTFIGSRAPVVLQDVCPTWTPFELVHPVSRGGGTFPDYRHPNLVEDGTQDGIADGARPRKYFEGQIVRLQSGATFEYYLCTKTHVVGPVNADDSSHPNAPGAGNPHWQLIGDERTPPPANGNPGPSDPQVYSMTPVWPMMSRLFPSDRFSDIDGNFGAFPTRTFAIPTTMDFAGDTRFPALRIYSPTANGTFGGFITVPAADTDGDGIADAGLFKLDVGTLEGLDYYAAIRVIDNNAAINVNTAFSQFLDFQIDPSFDDLDSGTDPAYDTKAGLLGAYKSHIGLYEWLNPAGGSQFGASLTANAARALEMDAINQWRFTNAPQSPNLADASAANAAITFLTAGEAIETDLSRRLGNPIGQYRAFSSGDGASLAYHGGVLRNPDASPTRLENALSNANTGAANVSDSHDPVYDRLPNRGTQVWKTYKEASLAAGPRNGHPYDAAFGNPGWPNAIWRWFDENFNQWGYVQGQTPLAGAWLPPNNPNASPTPVDGQTRLMLGADQFDDSSKPANATRRSMRPFLVSRNPTSNQAPVKLSATPAGFPTQLVFGPTIPRASVNRSGFAELWRAYWSTMAADWPQAPTGVSGAEVPFAEIYRQVVLDDPPPATPEYGSWHNNPFVGMNFASDSNAATAHYRDMTSRLPGQNPNRMFRSVLRPTFDTPSNPWNNNTPRMQPDQMVFLRSALAAVNTIDLRDSDDAITVQTVGIPATRLALGLPGDATPALEARIYGIERQPFITEIYADNNWSRRDVPPRVPDPAKEPTIAPDAFNENGYIAIELHNPHETPIDIRNCKIATINRQDDARRAAAGPDPSYLRDYDHDYTGTKLIVVDRTDPGLAADEQINLAAALTNMEQDSGGADYHDPWIIPAKGYLILENYDSRTNPDARAAQYRPPAVAVHPGGTLDKDGNQAFRGSQGPIMTQPDASNPFDPAITDRTHEQRISGFPLNSGIGAMNFAYVPNLDRLINQEFVLVRPLAVEAGARARIVGTANVPVLRYAEPTLTHASVMAPLDSFDFTGMEAAANLPARVHAWHYSRANYSQARMPLAGLENKEWRFVYPGRYDGNKSVAAATGGLQRPRQQGTDEARELQADGRTATDTPGWDPTSASHPWEVIPEPGGAPFGAPPQPGMSFGNPIADTGLEREDSTYPIEFEIQISNTDVPGPGTNAAGSNPNGGFLRNMDILHVPFIGAYRLQIVGQAAPEVLELNALPMDASFAEDTDPSNDPVIGGGEMRHEQIGRFCPLPEWDLSIAARGTLDDVNATFDAVRDFERLEPTAGAWAPADFWRGTANGISYEMVMTSGAAAGRSRMIYNSTGSDLTFFTPWANATTAGTAPVAGDSYEIRRGNYRWGTDLFDYVTVHSPQEDAVPNVPAAGAVLVDNYGRGADANDPIEGLININTASWRVLASIPWTPATADTIRFVESGIAIDPPTVPDIAAPPGQIAPIPNDIPDNYDIARAIVAFRDSEVAAGADPHRVFGSIFDLCRVPGLQFYSDYTYVAPPADLNDLDGDLSPQGAPGDGVRRDFEEQYLFLNRVSNLITTRSDSFTNYILVQGWRGTSDGIPDNEELVVQRRRAFMTDRSGVTTGQRDVRTDFFFNE